MSRENRLRSLFGEEFDTEQTPETMAFAASMEFSTQVILEMEGQEISLKALAEKIGVRPSTLCEKLNGKSNLTLKSAAEIAIALDCDLHAPKISKKSRVLASASITLTNTQISPKPVSFSPFFSGSSVDENAPSSTFKGGQNARSIEFSAAA